MQMIPKCRHTQLELRISVVAQTHHFECHRQLEILHAYEVEVGPKSRLVFCNLVCKVANPRHQHLLVHVHFDSVHLEDPTLDPLVVVPHDVFGL